VRGSVSEEGGPRLRIRGLGLRHGRRILVRDLQWRLGPGGIGWVVGPNGSGKSTLLAVLAGLETPDEGTVVLDGGSHDRDGIVYYEPGMDLPPEVGVPTWRELAAALARKGVGGGPVPVDLVPSTAGGGRTVRTLSTGERKRLLLDLLLRTPAALTVLDEPYEHLSPEAKKGLTRALRHRAGRSVVVVSTNQEPAVEEGRDAVLRLGVEEPGWVWQVEGRGR